MSTPKRFDYAAKTAELDAVLAKLQNPATPLDEAMKLHKQGRTLVQELDSFLQSAENEVRKQIADEA